MFNVDKVDFLSWYNEEYVSKGYDDRKIADEAWFDRVEESHQDIRHVLGGVQKTIEVVLRKSEEGVVSAESIYGLWQELMVVMPAGFATIHPVLGFTRSTTISTTYRQSMKWGKYIYQYIAENKPYFPLQLTDDNIKTAMSIVSKMGERWTNAKPEDIKTYITITTDPKAFVLMGHYSCDRGSCFKGATLNAVHKYILGQTKDTFVGLVSSLPEIDLSDIDKIGSGVISPRFWGIATDDYEVFNINNVYPKGTEQSSSFVDPLIKAFKAISGKEDIITTRRNIYMSGVYYNTNSGITLASKDKKLEPISISTNKEGLLHYRKCYSCGKNTEEMFDVDGLNYCNICTKEETFRKCEITGRLTRGSLILAYDFSGQQINAHQQAVKDLEYIRCPYQGVYIRPEDIVETSVGLRTSKWYMEKVLAPKCGECNKYIHGDIIIKHKEMTICTKCHSLLYEADKLESHCSEFTLA